MSTTAMSSAMFPQATFAFVHCQRLFNRLTLALQQSDDAVILQVRPRFPLFGGWKTQYTLGYNLPSYEVLSHEGSQFTLSIRFVVRSNDCIRVRNMQSTSLHRTTFTTTW